MKATISDIFYFIAICLLLGAVIILSPVWWLINWIDDKRKASLLDAERKRYLK